MSLHAEDHLVGALLLDHKCIERIDLQPHEFLNGFCREVFKTAQELAAENIAFDVVVLANKLNEKTGQDWLVPLAERAKDAYSSRYVEQYADNVKSDYQKFQAKEAAEQLIHTVDEDGPDAIDKAIQELMQLNISKKNYEHSMKETLNQAVDYIGEIHDMEGRPGIATGLTEVDHCLSGLRNGDFNVIGARPAMGKTAMLLNMLYGANEKVGMISAEQGSDQIGLRLISISGRIDSRRIRCAGFDDHDWEALNAAVSVLKDRQIWFYDKPAPTITDIQRQARQWKHNYDIKALYVDYIQRIKGSNPKLTTIEQVKQVSEGLKELARELNIPVVALAQVNRNVESRPDKRPGMSDLSDSSAIEKEADCVMTLYRDEVYNPESEFKGIAEICVCKNRHGPTGRIHVKWESRFMIFSDLETKYYG